MNKLLAAVIMTGFVCVGFAAMTSAQNTSVTGKAQSLPIPKAASSTTIVETPVIKLDSEKANLDEVNAREAEELKAAAAAKIASLRSAQAGNPVPTTGAKPAQTAPAAAPATIDAAKAADKAALDAIAAAKAAAAEANTAKAAFVRALNSGNAEVITKAAAEFETKDKAAVAAVAKAKEAVAAAKQAAKAADIVIVDDPSRTVKDRKDLPVVSKIETVRPTKDDKCDVDCMLAKGFTQKVVLQKDGRVRRDWLCYGEEQPDNTCKKTTVSVVTAGTVDDE